MRTEPDLMKKGWKKHTGILFVLPWLLGMTFFQLWPIVHSIIISLFDYSIFREKEFIGFGNFAELLFDDDAFWQSIKVTLKFVFYTVPSRIIFALLIATILNRSTKGIGIYRVIYYAPSLIGNSVAIAIIWKAIFDKNGIVNLLLSNIIHNKPLWLGNPKLALPTISLLLIWQFGSSMVIFLAGLKQIPKEQYEVASLDGAGVLTKFFKITIPHLSPLIFFNVLMQMITIFQYFTGPFVIYNGQAGPADSCLLLGIHIYRSAFNMFRLGYGSALSIMLGLMVGLVTIFIFRVEKKTVFYG